MLNSLALAKALLSPRPSYFLGRVFLGLATGDERVITHDMVYTLYALIITVEYIQNLNT